MNTIAPLQIGNTNASFTGICRGCGKKRDLKFQSREESQIYCDDCFYTMMNNVDALSPSQDRIDFIGSGDYKKIGEEFMRYFLELGELKPTDRVLDIGCGVGRMAMPLTKYLSNKGSYEGFDIVVQDINWCTEHITRQYPEFQFQCVDIVSGTYNPEGVTKSSNFSFPYADESFDFIFLTSVFTHMFAGDMENYVSEIARVLKPSGRVLATCFLLNDESKKLMGEGQSRFQFSFKQENCFVQDAMRPEDAIAFDESYLRRVFEKHELTIQNPIQFGAWCGRSNGLSFQDIVLARKSS